MRAKIPTGELKKSTGEAVARRKNVNGHGLTFSTRFYFANAALISAMLGFSLFVAYAVGYFSATWPWIFGLFIGGTIIAVVFKTAVQHPAVRFNRTIFQLDIFVAALICATLISSLSVVAMVLVKTAEAIPTLLVGVNWISLTQGKSVAVIIVGIGTALVGGAFYYFRLRQRFVYGFTEAAAGVAIAMHRVSIETAQGFPSDTTFYVAILTAGIYLVVRGLDNMYQAASADDPFVRRLRSWWRSLQQIAHSKQ